jgi:hypothetical protein
MTAVSPDKTQQPAGPRLLDLKAAAVYLGLSYWTVRDLVIAGGRPEPPARLPLLLRLTEATSNRGRVPPRFGGFDCVGFDNGGACACAVSTGFSVLLSTIGVNSCRTDATSNDIAFPAAFCHSGIGAACMAATI